jgi:putative N6-adenine-specific DNA methylase
LTQNHTGARMEIFLAVAPGLEPVLAQEARETGFDVQGHAPGGVTIAGDWPEVWRANLHLRGAARVLVRIGVFRAFHLAQLDKRARKFPWGETLRADIPVRVEATCRASKIYHDRAAAQRVARAISETLGAPATVGASGEGVRLLVRIEDDLVSLSLDSSGAPLHRRGHKAAVGKAPMRETLASLFLRACNYDGVEPVLDPMCGSGTFVMEAAEWAAGLAPGRARRFAFEDLAGFDADAWLAMKGVPNAPEGPTRFFGSDRDAGAVKAAQENAARAGLAALTRFETCAISDRTPPCDTPGLVIVNPPYGARIGNKKLLFSLYGALGKTLQERFSGWRVGLVTSEAGLAKATALPFAPPGPFVNLGGLKVRLWQTGPLA